MKIKEKPRAREVTQIEVRIFQRDAEHWTVSLMLFILMGQHFFEKCPYHLDFCQQAKHMNI